MMDLRTLQARFHALVTAPESVSRTLSDRGESARDVETFVAGDDRLSAVARLDIYANMYFFRLLDVLRDDYAKVLSAVGDEAFHNLVTEYLVACPPSHPSIAQAGARLPAFLTGHAFSAERPWLPALATLERAHSELFDGPDAEPVTLDQVRGMPPDELMEIVLQPIPCHRVVAHGFAIDELWRALAQGAPDEVPPIPEALLVWRQDVEVFHRPLEAEEQRLLPLFDGRTPLQAVCAQMPASSVEEAAQRLFQILARWIGDGLLGRG